MAYGDFKDLTKRTVGSGHSLQVTTNNENIQLADELHKPIIRKIKKRKVYSSFRDNILGADLADNY